LPGESLPELLSELLYPSLYRLAVEFLDNAVVGW
jgi:hypothetical protein